MSTMEDVNPYAAPRHDLALGAAPNEPGDSVWRDGNLLVMRKGAVLPDCCVKCNAPAEGRRLKVGVVWHGPIDFLGMRLPYLESHRAKIEVGLCKVHRRRIRVAAAWGVVLFTLGAGAMLVNTLRVIAHPIAPGDRKSVV